MTIEFRCPNCDKKLKTGEDKAGRAARCPQCGNSVTVPAASTAAADEFEAFSAFEELAPRRPAPVAQTSCPMCGAANDAASVRCRACGEQLQPPVGGAVFGDTGSLAFGDVFNTAFELWKAELGTLIAATLIAGIIAGVAYAGFYVVTLVLASMMQDAGAAAGVVSLIVILGGMIAFFTLILFLALGMVRLVTDVARRRPAQLGVLFSEGGKLPTMWLNSFFIGLLSVLAGLPGIALIVAGFAGAAQGDNDALILLAIFGYLLYVAALIVVPQLFWPAAFLIADGARGVTPLSEAFRLVRAKPGLTALMVIVSVLLSVAGTLACYVGQILTIPLTMMMYAVAYDRLSRAFLRR